MAAHNPSEEISAEEKAIAARRAEKEEDHGAIAEIKFSYSKDQIDLKRKVVVFDKDRTLISDETRDYTPINPDEHREIFSYITSDPNITWGIASTGGGEINQRDDEFNELDKDPRAVSNDNTLFQFREQILNDGVRKSNPNSKGNNVAINANSGYTGKENYFNAPKYRRSLCNVAAESQRAHYTADGWEEISLTVEEKDKIHGLLENDASALFKEGQIISLTLKSGIKIFMDAHILLSRENHSRHKRGDGKLFQVLEGLSRQNIAVIPGKEMRAMGIIGVIGGKDTKFIHPSQVFGLDDKTECVEFWREAGFKAAVADSKIAHQEQAAAFVKDLNMYFSKKYVLKDEIDENRFSVYFSWEGDQFRDKETGEIQVLIKTKEVHFDNTDIISYTEDGVQKESNIRDFLMQHKGCNEKEKRKVKITHFLPGKDKPVNTYFDPLSQHLGLQSYEELHSIVRRKQKIMAKQNKQLRVFLFDKDNTLIYYDERISNVESFVINEIEHREIFQYIIRNPETMQWIMVSASGGAMITSRQPEVAMDASLNNFRNVVLRDSYDPEDIYSGQDGKENFFCAESHRRTMLLFFAEKSIFTGIIPDVRREVIENGVINKMGGENYLTLGSSMYRIKDCIDLECPNGVVYRLDLYNFLRNRDLHNEGDNKIIQALHGMAGAGIAIIPNDAMKAVGIELIDPGTCVTIEAEQVFGLDDQIGCVAAWKAVGFKAELANSEPCIADKARLAIRAIKDALDITNKGPYKVEDLQDGKFLISFINHYGDVKNSIFNDTDTIAIGDTVVNLKAFLNERQSRASPEAVEIVGFNSDKVVPYSNYIEPLVQHLNVESFKELCELNRAAENCGFYYKVLLKVKDYIVGATNAQLSVPIEMKDLSDAGSGKKEKGYKTRFIFSFVKNNSFEKEAFMFLKKVMEAQDIMDIINILHDTYARYPGQAELFQDIYTFIEKTHGYTEGFLQNQMAQSSAAGPSGRK